MCRRDLQCLLTSKVFDAIVCGGGGGGEDGSGGGGGGGDDGDIAAARGEKSWLLLLEGVALGKVVPVCETVKQRAWGKLAHQQ